MSVLAVFAADTHLSENSWASRSSIRGDSFFAFRQLCDLAIGHRCPLLIAGDCWELLHDPKPTAETIKFVRECLDNLRTANCPFYYVNGQHDKLSRPYWFQSIHDHPKHVGGQVFELGGERWYGIDYFEPYQSQHVYSEVPEGIDGVLAHQRWAEFAGSKHFASETLQSLSTVPIVVSGDMHKLIVNDITIQVQASPGATHMRTLSEPRDHYCLLYKGRGAESAFGTHQLASRAVLEYDVQSEMEWVERLEEVRAEVIAKQADALSKGVPAEVSKPLVVINDMVGCDAGKLLTRVTDVPHVECRFVSQRSQAEAEAPDEEVSVGQAIDVLAVAKKVANRRAMTPAAIKLLESLVSGGSLLEMAMQVAEEESNNVETSKTV